MFNSKDWISNSNEKSIKLSNMLELGKMDSDIQNPRQAVRFESAGMRVAWMLSTIARIDPSREESF